MDWRGMRWKEGGGNCLIKSSVERWDELMTDGRTDGHVTRTRATVDAQKVLAGKAEGKNHSEDIGLYGRIILKWIIGV